MKSAALLFVMITWVLSLAVVGCKKAKQHQSLTAFDHSMEGDALLKHGQLNDAMHEYQTAIRLDAASWYSHYQLADVYEKTGRYDAAIAEYRQATKLIPTAAGKAFPHFRIGEVLAKKGQPPQACSEWRTALSIASQDEKPTRKLKQLIPRLRQVLKTCSPTTRKSP